MPAEPITGRLATPGISVRFEDGSVDVHDEEIVNLMLAHPRFKRDFIAPELVEGKDANKDIFAADRRNLEPEHTMTELKYGHIGETKGAPGGIKANLSRDKAQQLQKAIDEAATKKAMALAPELAKQLIQNPECVKSLKQQIEKKEVAKPDPVLNP
ncbi:MAG: hypothetical protein JJV99_03775, partial [Colwellia sp.]|nr:hypothetical protein [Colwellia sp.]